MEERHIVLAGRASLLAKAQNRIIMDKLKPMGYRVTELRVTTRGDRDKTTPVIKLGGNGLFVREVEKVLLSGEADIAVHCVKDLPYDFAEGLVIAGVLDEADPRDVLLIRKEKEGLFSRLASASGQDSQVSASRQDTPAEAHRVCACGGESFVVGTGSPRRVSQLRRRYPFISCAEIRGNIDTRIEKLRRGEYDAIALAKAGLDRAGLDVSDLGIRILGTNELVPAVGQGLLAVQCREDDHLLRKQLFDMSDARAYARFMLEREIFCRFRCNCDDPIGIYADIDADKLKVDIRVNTAGGRI